MLETLLIIVHVVVSAAIIGLVLMQHGKGADAGAAFGSGASQTVFGSQGSGSFLTRSTAILAAVFFTTSLSLAYLASNSDEVKSVTETAMPAADFTGSDIPMIPLNDTATPADVPAVPGQAGGSVADVPVDVVTEEVSSETPAP